jgi:hypothetical protein
MNISRISHIALLSVLFVAPNMMADETAVVNQSANTDITKVDAPTGAANTGAAKADAPTGAANTGAAKADAPTGTANTGAAKIDAPKKDEPRGFFGKTKDLAFAVAAFPFVTAPDFIANKFYIVEAIKAVTSTKYLKGSFVDKPELIGRFAVLAAATAAAIYAYNTYYADQEVAEDNDPIFEENN